MSSILDARKNFLSVLRSTGIAPDLKKALIEWSYGRPRLLNNKYPGLAQSLMQSFEFHFVTFDLIKCLSTDSIERAAEEIEEESLPILVAEKQPSYQNRPFDIVDKYELLIHFEKALKKCRLLNPRRIFIYNRRKCNKQCIIGFICVMFRNGIFKNVYNDKPGPDKTITFHDVLEYCQIRYHFGSLETSKKPLNICIQKALERIPGLKQFDDQNYQKNQTNLNIKKS